MTSTLIFAAPPGTVAAMFIDPEFAARLATEMHAENFTVSIIDNGLTAVYTVASPDATKNFLGETMTVTQTTAWDAGTGPVRTGRLTMSVTGMPAVSDGPLRLTATEEGSLLVYDAEFVVSVPLVGRVLEEMASQNLSRMIAALQQVGDAWLEDVKR